MLLFKISSFLLILFATASFSQHKSFDSSSQLESPDVNSYTSVSKKSLSKDFSQIENDVIDKAIDSVNYIVGPGDIFIVYIWSSEKKQLLLPVNIEGNIIIPMIGDVSVNYLTLSSAKENIRKKINEVYKNVQITIVLNNIRKFKSYVYGEITKNGSYIVTGNIRISDLILMAGGITKNGKKRGIILYNEFTKNTRYADLTLTENISSFEKNPYLLEGDRVFIPPRKEIVFINGFINYPGVYDYCANDKIKDIITIAGGFARGADSTNIVIYQFQNMLDSMKCTRVNLRDLDSFNVNQDDRIFVYSIPDYQLNRSVVIKGEVKNPGQYPISRGKTTLSNVIDMAGGLTEYADLRTGRIIRSKFEFPGESEYQKLKKKPQASQFPLEKSYFLTKLTEHENTLNFSFNDIFRNNNNEIILECDDTILITEKIPDIKIIGAVKLPGLIPFLNGSDYKYYIKRVGGFSTNANTSSIKIIKLGSENQVKVNKTTIEPGDVIWVPEKKYIDKLLSLKDGVIFIGAIATTIISIIAIQDRFR